MAKSKFKIEEIVFLITNPEKLPRMVTQYTVSKTSVRYQLSCGTCETWHYDYEITREVKEENQVQGFAKK